MQAHQITDIKQAKEILAQNNIELLSFEHNIFYSSEDASRDMKDFKANIEDCSLWLGDRSTDYLVIFADKSTMDAPHFKKYQLQRMRKAELLELAENLDEWYYQSIEKETKAELIDFLLTIDNEKYYKKHFESTRYHDLEYTFTATGYSQGDAVKVLLVGKTEPYLNEDYITNMFFDAPIYGDFEIYSNGELLEEFKLWGCDNFDSYSFYDKDKTLERIKKHVEGKSYAPLFIEYLEENLPSSLDYK